MPRGTAVKIVLSAEEGGELETRVRRRKSSHAFLPAAFPADPELPFPLPGILSHDYTIHSDTGANA